MTASSKTVENVIRVVRKHVDDATFRVIVRDLLDVSGNVSFRETIRMLADKLMVDR